MAVSRSHWITLFALLISAVLIESAHADEPAMFRGNAQHSGLYDSAGIATKPKLRWKFKTDGAVISSPTLANGTLYFGSTDHFVYAVDATTGTQRWKTKTEGRVASSAAVADGRVFIESYDGKLYALDAKTGETRWTFKTAGERRFTAPHLHGAQPAAEMMADPFDFYLSSPLIAGGVVYLGSGDGHIYAVQADSGALKWKFKTGDVVHASPAMADGTLFIGSWDTFFYALDAATGQVKWRYKTGEDHDIYNQTGIQSSAVVADGTVYFGCRDSKVYALDAHTGAERWTFSNKGSWVIGTPIAKGDRVYFTTSDSGMFRALEASSGKQVFELKLLWPMFSSPVIARNTLYLGSHAGKLLAIDLQAQSLRWEFQTEGARENGAKYTKADGTPNYAAAFTDFFHDDMIVGVSRMMSVGAVLSTPALSTTQGSGDAIYFGSMDGHVYALG